MPPGQAAHWTMHGAFRVPRAPEPQCFGTLAIVSRGTLSSHRCTRRCACVQEQSSTGRQVPGDQSCLGHVTIPAQRPARSRYASAGAPVPGNRAPEAGGLLQTLRGACGACKESTAHAMLFGVRFQGLGLGASANVACVPKLPARLLFTLQAIWSVLCRRKHCAILLVSTYYFGLPDDHSARACVQEQRARSQQAGEDLRGGARARPVLVLRPGRQRSLQRRAKRRQRFRRRRLRQALHTDAQH